MQKSIHFVTGNANKFHEVKTLITREFPEYLVIQKDLPLKELQANTLEEVAEFKVMSIIDLLPPPYFIEDAGFFVDDVCKGFPGVYSHYVMDTLGYNGILKIMGNSKDRRAHFEACIAYVDENKKLHFFKGENRGNVSHNARGDSGFGFDPIFESNDIPDKTFAELNTGEKNKISHRRRAVEKLLEFLKEE